MTARAEAPGRARPAARRDRMVALAAVAAVAAAATVGALAARAAEPGLYEGLDRPAWSPPAWLFSPVWTALYVMMAVAAWLVARRGTERREVRVALVLFAVQLALNAAWTPIFFGAERFGWAAVEITVLLIAVAATAAAFARVSRPAGALMLPYLAWVAFATALNVAIAL